MKLLGKNVPGKSKTPLSSILMYAGGLLIFLIAVASLVNNIMLFNKTVAQYVDQGYPSAEVLKQLIPAQLLPGIFEAVAVYAGIAFILVAVGFLNRNIFYSLRKTEEMNNHSATEEIVAANAEEPLELPELEEAPQKFEESEEVSQNFQESEEVLTAQKD